jgi:hypothetical protein
MTSAARTVAWLVFWATLGVALLLGAFLAWVLSEVLPPGTVITVDDERFVLPAFTHYGHWLTAVIGVLLASLVIVILLPIVMVLALVVPVVAASVSLIVAVALTALLLWPLFLLARWVWKQRRKPTTIAA